MTPKNRGVPLHGGNLSPILEVQLQAETKAGMKMGCWFYPKIHEDRWFVGCSHKVNPLSLQSNQKVSQGEAMDRTKI